MRAQPEQTLDSDDEACPHHRPFLRTDIFLVQRRGEIIVEEDGPDDGKRPDVGVEIDRERFQQLGVLDLIIVDQRRHGGGPVRNWSTEVGRYQSRLFIRLQGVETMVSLTCKSANTRQLIELGIAECELCAK